MEIEELRERIRHWKVRQQGGEYADAMAPAELSAEPGSDASAGSGLSPEPSPDNNVDHSGDFDVDLATNDSGMHMASGSYPGEAAMNHSEEIDSIEVETDDSVAASASPQPATQDLYAQLTPDHLSALQQYGQQLAAQGYTADQIAAAQQQYAQQMVMAMQQQASQSPGSEGGSQT